MRRGDISLEVVNIFVGQLAFEFGAEVFEVGHGVLHELLDRHVRDFPERNHNCGNIKQSLTCSLAHSLAHSLTCSLTHSLTHCLNLFTRHKAD